MNFKNNSSQLDLYYILTFNESQPTGQFESNDLQLR